MHILDEKIFIVNVSESDGEGTQGLGTKRQTEHLEIASTAFIRYPPLPCSVSFWQRILSNILETGHIFLQHTVRLERHILKLEY